jgi:hypothetical protein
MTGALALTMARSKSVQHFDGSLRVSLDFLALVGRQRQKPARR